MNDRFAIGLIAFVSVLAVVIGIFVACSPTG